MMSVPFRSTLRVYEDTAAQQEQIKASMQQR
jgi:hypothetical protein